MRTREPLDIYDIKPSGMRAYMRHYGKHFSKPMCDFAVSLMRKKASDGSKEEPITQWTKEQVEEMLTKYGVKLENKLDYDFVFVANMAKADYYQSSLKDEESVAKFVKDMVDDCDQNDGFIFCRFLTDCANNGIAIPWEDVI